MNHFEPEANSLIHAINLKGHRLGSREMDMISVAMEKAFKETLLAICKYQKEKEKEQNEH